MEQLPRLSPAVHVALTPSRPNTGDKLRAFNTLSARQLHPLVGRPIATTGSFRLRVRNVAQQLPCLPVRRNLAAGFHGLAASRNNDCALLLYGFVR
jgi:hypothetical protein